ncbi:SUMF1/EgtB/PvdO family nonheme iron enzyme [Agrococcus sp. ProA11]|uniref:SUMF1/EgtB/PvdO family nonheme iron enzyme n=1 Tax=Agrococcus chionoecetis TaxID=3153752 RepID=UPI0032612BC4
MIPDPDEAPTNTIDPLVPRPIDLPTAVPLPDEGGVPLAEADFDIAKILAAPADPARWPAWRAELERLAVDARRRLAHDDAAYDRVPWASGCRVAAQIWLWDERLWDWRARTFTPERLLAAYEGVGGLDGLVLWHAYPCIGIDARNQFDWYREVPGLAALVADLKAAGVRVFLDYNPWDVGTRRETDDAGRELTDGEALRRLADELGAEGVFLDTLKQADPAFLDAVGGDRPLALEGESRAPNERLRDHVLSWAQWFADSTAPGVQRARLVERRHMLHGIRRWNRSHAEELQSAWMNGTGVLVWDAVFGVWVGWNERDRATLRAMSRVQRACHELLERGDWQPLAGATAEAADRGVFGTTWALGDLTLVTLINRGDEPVRGRFLAPLEGALVDLLRGEPTDGEVVVPAHGIAAVLAVRGERPDWVGPLLEAARADDRSQDATFPARATSRIPTPQSTARPPHDAVAVPAGTHELAVLWRRRETGLYGEAPYVEEWKPLPPRLHDDRRIAVTAEVGPAAVALREVSVAEWNAECDRAGLARRDGDADAPVSGIDLDEARAFAAAVGARLPTDHEWQLAGAMLERRSPRVWNWTESEMTDGITRRVILKGGSDRAVTGSDWYADGGEQPPERSLAWLRTGIDRSPAIGFRLAWDAEQAS